MTRQEFAVIGELLDAWPGEFTDHDEGAYYALLSDLDADAVARAVRALRRQKFRPSPADIVEAVEPQRALVPTFDEVLTLLYARGGVLDVRVQGTTDTNPRYRTDMAAAVAARLGAVHPLLAEFVRRMRLGRLLAMSIDDPDEGKWHRRELRQAWERHVEAMEGREIAALALPSGQRQDLGHLDPLAALGAGDRRQLGTGE